MPYSTLFIIYTYIRYKIYVFWTLDMKVHPSITSPLSSSFISFFIVPFITPFRNTFFLQDILGFFSFSLHIRSRNKAYPIWHRYYVNVIIPLDVKQCIILHIRLLIFKFSHTNENKLCIEIYNKTTNRIHVKSVSRHHVNPRPQAIGPRSDIGISV